MVVVAEPVAVAVVAMAERVAMDFGVHVEQVFPMLPVELMAMAEHQAVEPMAMTAV
jgi:hypothetical protein